MKLVAAAVVILGLAQPTAVWVSESAAVDAHGDLRTEVFAEHEMAILRRNLERNASGDCTTFLTQPELEHVRPQQTLADVVTHSRLIVAGTVTSATAGFFRGLPGTLLALQPVERLKAVVPVSDGDTLYVFIPQAKIGTRAGALCSTMSGALPSVPEAGASIVAFVYGNPGDAQKAILEVDPARHLLVQPRGQERMLPNRLSSSIDPAMSIGELIGVIRRSVIIRP